MNYKKFQKYQKYQKSHLMTDEQIETSLAEEKPHIKEKLWSLLNSYWKLCIDEIETKILTYEFTKSEEWAKNMFNYYNFINIFVDMFESYIYVYFQDYQYGLFALFFDLIFKKNPNINNFLR